MHGSSQRFSRQLRQTRSLWFAAVFACIGVALLLRSSADSPIDYSGLQYKAGAYALAKAADAPNAAAVGLQLTIGNYSGPTNTNSKAMAANGIAYIDDYAKDQLYAAECPGGTGTCQPLSAAAKQQLTQVLVAHLQITKNDPAVAAYYILDDNWGNLTDGLSTVYQAIRSVDPTKPTICGIAANLATTPSSTDPLTPFTKALQNYSPSWCNAVMLYSYSPTFTSPPNVTVDWDMSSTISTELQALRNLGWSSNTQPLIGTVQAYAFNPRTSKSGGVATPTQYRVVPTAAELAQEITAFCQNGASTIIGYAWNDGSAGPSPDSVPELYNSADLRTGFSSGVATCRAQYWSKPAVTQAPAKVGSTTSTAAATGQSSSGAAAATATPQPSQSASTATGSSSNYAAKSSQVTPRVTPKSQAITKTKSVKDVAAIVSLLGGVAVIFGFLVYRIFRLTRRESKL